MYQIFRHCFTVTAKSLTCHYLHIRLILVSANHAHFIQNCLSDRSGSGLETCMANLEKDIASANLRGSLIQQILLTFNCSKHFSLSKLLTSKLWSSRSGKMTSAIIIISEWFIFDSSKCQLRFCWHDTEHGYGRCQTFQFCATQ